LEHPILTRIQREGFTVLGWFSPNAADQVPHAVRLVILFGNTGPVMFRRFSRESKSTLDQWTKTTVDHLASELDAQAVYPFDKPPLPFLAWARRAGAGHTSPLGLNIHHTYGLWHAYRAALLFPVEFDLPRPPCGPHPCETCETKPCLSACPVSAFNGTSYNVAACAAHISSPEGENCMSGGCKARLACPVGKRFEYPPEQKQFHMKAFLQARQ
jgi:epoxyqueuosine reductase QueG